MHYVAIIDGEPGGFGVVFPDLPGCTAMGDTMDEALANAQEAARDWAEATEAQGRPVPLPRGVSQLREDEDVKATLAEGGALATVVLLRRIGRPTKVNMSLDSGVLAAIDSAAGRLKITRSAFVERLAADHLSEYA